MISYIKMLKLISKHGKLPVVVYMPGIGKRWDAFGDEAKARTLHPEWPSTMRLSSISAEILNLRLSQDYWSILKADCSLGAIYGWGTWRVTLHHDFPTHYAICQDLSISETIALRAVGLEATKQAMLAYVSQIIWRKCKGLFRQLVTCAGCKSDNGPHWCIWPFALDDRDWWDERCHQTWHQASEENELN